MGQSRLKEYIVLYQKNNYKFSVKMHHILLILQSHSFELSLWRWTHKKFTYMIHSALLSLLLLCRTKSPPSSPPTAIVQLPFPFLSPISPFFPKSVSHSSTFPRPLFHTSSSLLLFILHHHNRCSSLPPLLLGLHNNMI